MADQGAGTAAANAASMDAQVTRSNDSRQRLRRVQRRGALSDRLGIRALKGKSLRNKVEERPDAHYGVTDQSDLQPEANLRKRPCHHESRYEGQFERRASRYPELPSRNSTAIELNDIWTARPEGIDHEKFMQASAKTDQRQIPAKANSGRSSLSANQTKSFLPVARFGSGAYSEKHLAGTRQRLSGLSQPSQ
jgi:hypothetical protein